MSKVNLVASASLFGASVPYETKPPRLSIMVVAGDSKEDSSVKHVCIEDKAKDLIPMCYREVTLSNLIAKGVAPQSLNLIDTQKLGVDAGIDKLSQFIIQNADKYVESSKS